MGSGNIGNRKKIEKERKKRVLEVLGEKRKKIEGKENRRHKRMEKKGGRRKCENGKNCI